MTDTSATRSPRGTIEALIQNAELDALQDEDTQAADALGGAAGVLPAWDAMLAALEALVYSDELVDIISPEIDAAIRAIAQARGGEKVQGG